MCKNCENYDDLYAELLQIKNRLRITIAMKDQILNQLLVKTKECDELFEELCRVTGCNIYNPENDSISD